MCLISLPPGLIELQGVPRDPAHQRDQVHHVAQRLLPIGAKPQEMVRGATTFSSSVCLTKLL